MKIVITGAGGFLGQHFVSYLHEKKIRPYCIIRNEDSLPAVKERVQLDLLNKSDVISLISRLKPDYVVHMASDLAERRQLDVSYENESKTYSMGVNLIDALHKYSPTSRLVSIGSCEEYGNLNEKFEEDSQCAPFSLYGASKLRVTKLICSKYGPFTCPSIILRPSVIYGTDQSSNFLVPSLIRSLISDNRFSMTSGTQVRDYVHVKDVCSAIFKAMFVDPVPTNPIVNVASGVSISIKELALLIADLVGPQKKELIDFGYRQHSEPSDFFYSVSIRKAQSLFSWTPKKDLRNGMLEVINKEISSFNSIGQV